MIHGGVKDIKISIIRMKHRKTHYKKRHNLKKRLSRTLRKRKIIKHRGGLSNPCAAIQDKFDHYKAELNYQTAESIEDYYGEIRSLYDEANSIAGCNYLANQIQEFEYGPLSSKMNELLSV